jgi:hypothetical protein
MKFWLSIFAIWSVPSAVWITFAAIHGRLAFDDMGWREAFLWRETTLLAPPIVFGVVILAVLWILDRWPSKNG